MKIPEIGPGEFPQIKKTQRVKPAEATTPSAATKDTVEVGGDALLVSRLRTKLAEAGTEVDPRVRELAQQVADGTYEPDPGELARILFGLEAPY